MFKRKKSSIYIRLMGSDDTVLYDGPIVNMAVPEPVVLSLSMEFFRDPEPCNIHRGAVLSRVFTELQAATGSHDEVNIDALPATMHAYLSSYQGVKKIAVYSQVIK